MKDIMSYCQRCGNCCRYPEAVHLNEADLKRFYAFYGDAKTVRQFVKFKDGQWQLKKVQPCQYLQGNDCMIYEMRPLACQNFPLTKEGNDVIFHRMSYCKIPDLLPKNAHFKVVSS